MKLTLHICLKIQYGRFGKKCQLISVYVLNLGSAKPSNLRAKFENLAKQGEEEARKRAVEEKERRKVRDKQEEKEAKLREEKRLKELKEQELAQVSLS